MKRLGLMLLILPLFSSAEVVVPIDSVEDNVNVRMLPDSKSEIVGRLEQGDSLPLVESIPGWHEVEIVGGATGYISADWTNVLGEVSVDELGNALADEPGEMPTAEAHESVVADLVERSTEALVDESVAAGEPAGAGQQRASDCRTCVDEQFIP